MPSPAALDEATMKKAQANAGYGSNGNGSSEQGRAYRSYATFWNFWPLREGFYKVYHLSRSCNTIV